MSEARAALSVFFPSRLGATPDDASGRFSPGRVSLSSLRRLSFFLSCPPAWEHNRLELRDRQDRLFVSYSESAAAANTAISSDRRDLISRRE